MADEYEEEAPGWDALDDALAKLYGRQEPVHFDTVTSFRAGGKDPLDAISAYSAADKSHWHYITYGFSELYDKESDDEEHSGFGFELTFRLERKGSEQDPPAWPANFLQSLARYVFETGNAFDAGHNMTLHGPITTEHKTEISAAAFVEDPQLGTIQTPHGRVAFLQVVGLTRDEFEFIQGWNTPGLIALLKEQEPLLVTRLARPSLLKNSRAAQKMREGAARDGSELGVLYVTHLKTKPGKGANSLLLELEAAAVPQLQRVLPGRLPHGRELLIASDFDSLKLKPSAEAKFIRQKKGWTIELSNAHLTEILSGLKPKPGTYTWAALKGFEIRIVPSEIRDRDGVIVDKIG
ncbi:MAG TPA: suppressor of fused domain protein [Prosthecobacter sp.]|nr:suppressor of fused domain protein [Prosthecobacter sp.]